MRSRCKDSSDFRRQAFPYAASVAVPSFIDLSKKVRIQSPVIITSSLMKSATTGQWWSEERQSEIRSCFLSDWGRSCTQSAALFILTGWQTPREKHIFSVYNLKRKHANVGHQSQSCLPQLILCCFKFTHMKYLYSTEKLFQTLPFPPALCLLHPD